MLLRVVKSRQTSWEEGDLETICLAEFSYRDRPGLDLTLSVYEMDDRARAPQALAEHCAAQDLDRPMTRVHTDLAGLGPPPTYAPTEAPFAFIRDAHREIRLASDDAVRELVASLLEDLAARRIEVTGDAIKDYVRARLVAADPEWITYCQTSPKGQKWRRFENRA